MQITRARSAGFCFGVRRAVEQVYEQAGKGKKVYTFGPIIHNEQVVADLREKGVEVVDSLEKLRAKAGIADAVVIIRSHGVDHKTYEALLALGADIVDASCPFVNKIHRIVACESKKGRFVVIIGNGAHPEVQGIRGWCSGRCQVVEGDRDIAKLPDLSSEKVSVVAQTTFNLEKFEELVEKISKKSYDINVLNTICNATKERQTEAKHIARSVDAMIVVGDKHSSNTQKLYDICKNECKYTYFIEALVDLDLKPFQSFRHVGITAGASTPNKIIEEVQTHVRTKF